MDADAEVDIGGSAIALPEFRQGELKRVITPKVGITVMTSLLCSARRLIVVNISAIFRENISNGF